MGIHNQTLEGLNVFVLILHSKSPLLYYFVFAPNPESRALREGAQLKNREEPARLLPEGSETDAQHAHATAEEQPR